MCNSNITLRTPKTHNTISLTSTYYASRMKILEFYRKKTVHQGQSGHATTSTRRPRQVCLRVPQRHNIRVLNLAPQNSVTTPNFDLDPTTITANLPTLINFILPSKPHSQGVEKSIQENISRRRVNHKNILG